MTFSANRTSGKFVLWAAQGFGSGYSPVGPGTAGSLVGVLWLWLLLLTGNIWWFFAGAIGAIFLSVWLCGEAEAMLGRRDPGSVVMDEIIAVPLSYASWMCWVWWQEGALPRPLSLFDGVNWPWGVGILVLFRVFDIAKPWPIFKSQSLPGGWGITIDDVLAAVYVNVCWLGWQLGKSLLNG